MDIDIFDDLLFIPTFIMERGGAGTGGRGEREQGRDVVADRLYSSQPAVG